MCSSTSGRPFAGLASGPFEDRADHLVRTGQMVLLSGRAAAWLVSGGADGRVERAELTTDHAHRGPVALGEAVHAPVLSHGPSARRLPVIGRGLFPVALGPLAHLATISSALNRGGRDGGAGSPAPFRCHARCAAASNREVGRRPFGGACVIHS